MITKKEFSNEVEDILGRSRDASNDVMGAIIKVCENNNIEPESAKRLLTPPLKEKLEAEAQGLNLINRGRTSQGTITRFYED